MTNQNSTPHGARPGARPAPASTSALACAAPGCPWVGSSGDAGRFLCIAHVGQESNQWDAVTRSAVELEWFAAFIGDIQRMVNFPRKGEPGWISYAAQFWATTDPTMPPTPAECKAPELYLYRLFGELRAMTLGKDRPAQHVPQGQQSAWQPHSQPVGEVAA